MEMVARGDTGIAHITDQLALGNGLSLGYNVMSHVHINILMEFLYDGLLKIVLNCMQNY